MHLLAVLVLGDSLRRGIEQDAVTELRGEPLGDLLCRFGDAILLLAVLVALAVAAGAWFGYLRFAAAPIAGPAPGAAEAGATTPSASPSPRPSAIVWAVIRCFTVCCSLEVTA